MSTHSPNSEEYFFSTELMISLGVKSEIIDHIRRVIPISRDSTKPCSNDQRFSDDLDILCGPHQSSRSRASDTSCTIHARRQYGASRSAVTKRSLSKLISFTSDCPSSYASLLTASTSSGGPIPSQDMTLVAPPYIWPIMAT